MDYNHFVTEFYTFSKIDLNSYKEGQMKRRIDSHIKKSGISDYREFLTLLKTNPKAYETFLGYLTINVSEFFRDPRQWATLEKDILPGIINVTKTFNVWSAACSTGDEPYTLAILLTKLIPSQKFKIIATDIDKDILAKAKTGIYPDKQVINLPADFKSKYFKKTTEGYIISDDIKRKIDFRQHNLLKDPYPSDIDLIVCRNVLIYFTEQAKADIYNKFSKSLSSTGILFVGSTEQIINAHDFGLKSKKLFFYSKA
ncbi:CheR family methyltransferase [Candidatus Epulonipiscium viviparus]|uniref:CheR family methyltransferase n=1 Tax=Candidatus Epulonipiscium viviparus TaxID=420336 RepID=UPI00016C0032|nr:protein-glutamate O-methyltransferase CheR [Candidatus Epulopiscium viviparus]